MFHTQKRIYVYRGFNIQVGVSQNDVSCVDMSSGDPMDLNVFNNTVENSKENINCIYNFAKQTLMILN